MQSLLFVCTGNQCRSPMAVALFYSHLREKRLDESLWRVESAGTWTEDGYPATRYARETMILHGLDISGHKSRVITGDIIHNFNLTLVMTADHKEALKTEFPDLSSRIFMLSEMFGQKEDVADPIGGEPAEYEACAQKIDQWIQLGWDNILLLSQP